MARPLSDAHRRISAGFIGSYLGKRNQCLRDVVIWLLAGPDSTRSGLLRVHVGALADDLGHSKPAVIDALTRLHNDGHIVWDADHRTALCWFVIRNVTLPAETNRKSYLTECNVFNDCQPRREAIKWIQAIEITVANGAQRRLQSSYPSTHLGGAQQRTENREQRTESTSVAKATDTPAVASMAPWALPSEPQADEEPPPFDWSTIAPTPDPYLDPSYRPEPRLTPEAQARVDRLKAEKAQQTLTLTPPKPSKTLTPGQLDAIFAKKRMAATVDLWNELLGKSTCGPCSHKEVAKMATQLMSNLAKYVSSEQGHDGSALIGWAKAKSEYHSGRAGRTWTLQKWLTTEHLAQVFADYRNERGEDRKIRYLPDRTLTDWRLAVEAEDARIAGQVAA